MAIKRREIRRPWPLKETDRLLRLLARGATQSECASTLGRSLRSIQTKKSRLGRTRTLSTRGKRRYEIQWTKRDDATLEKLIHTYTVEQICERLGRTRYAVWRRASDLGLSRRLPPLWCYRDIVKLLMSTAPHAKVELAQVRSKKAVSVKRARLRRLFKAGRLNEYIRNAPGAPSNYCLRFYGSFPPGLYRDWARLNRKAKDKRARQYLARETDRQRQKAAFKKWRARQPMKR